ncbi:hypothetical protein K501DRAFT_296163 [Backusella circina FSU 941]|nr:hypothetical protein K501DRAFT_296163 [Backusella circina FSU 941]
MSTPSSSSSSSSQDIKIDKPHFRRYSNSANGNEPSRSSLDASSIEPGNEKMLKFRERQPLAYIPRLDYKPVLISNLPNEIMLCIISHLALHATWTIPSIARVCKRFYLYTRDPTVWKYVCIRVFKTPFMTLKESQVVQKSYLSKYNDSWLCMFIARSRIHYNGVYISTCQYVRRGVSDTGWDQPVHLVTYYRYLRFFPNGTVLHHITTRQPHKVVRELHQGFLKRQTFHGIYHHLDDTLQIEMSDPNVPREKFCLVLKVKPKKGRQIKLGWESYSSMPMMTEGGELHPFNIDMFKPFFFSPFLHGRFIWKREDVDFSGKKYKINFMMQPNGTLANDYGQLSQPISLRFSSLKTYHIDAGDALNPIQVEFAYAQGDEIDYPFDYYSGFFQLSAHYLNDTTQSIPITFHLEASITSFHFMPTLESDTTIMNGDDDKIALKIITGRSTTTMGFSVFTCILMWLLSILMGLFAYQVVFRKRRADAHACMIGITTLFALPAVRSAQPGIPQVGCVSDILGFYWNMAIIACSSIGIIMCWIIRWDSHYHDHEENANKHRSMFSDYPSPVRQYNRNESSEAFSEHVQATIRLTKVALELEWTIFTRFTVGVLFATVLSIMYLVFTLRNSRRPLVVWERLNKPLIKLFRARIFSFLLGNVNPYSGSIDMKITTFSRGYCTGFMRDRKKNRNPFRSIHATAIATFAETVSELALLGSLNNDKDEIRLDSLELEFKKKARGLITASTDVNLPDNNQLSEETSQVKSVVVVKDRTLETVAIAHFVWIIDRKSD